MFRHRLLKRTAVFLAGSLAFPYVSQIYPPLELDWILVFFVLAATLFLNGELDSQKKMVYYTTTVDSRYNMPGIVRGTRRLFVHSWREGQRYERLAVNADDYDRFRSGDSVVVAVEPGALGIPWYYGIYRH